MTGKERAKARAERLEEELLDELAPTRYGAGRSRAVGRVRRIKGDMEAIAEGDATAERVQLEAGEWERFLKDGKVWAILDQARRHHEEHFPGVPFDNEMAVEVVLMMSPTALHSGEAAMRVSIRQYAEDLRDTHLGLIERGRPLTAEDKRSLVSAFTGWCVFTLNNPSNDEVARWVANKLREFGITAQYVKAALEGRSCANCGEPIPESRGKQAKFCDHACQQNAYRARRKLVTQTA